MKDSLFEILLSLFEKTITELKQIHQTQPSETDQDIYTSSLRAATSAQTFHAEIVQSAEDSCIRVFTYDEKMKLTKASYQFLTRLLLWKIIHPDTLEIILNQLLFSDSRIVTLEETKWTIRNTLSEELSTEQLAFLDLVLYQKEDEYPIH